MVRRRGVVDLVGKSGRGGRLVEVSLWWRRTIWSGMDDMGEIIGVDGLPW